MQQEKNIRAFPCKFVLEEYKRQGSLQLFYR